MAPELTGVLWGGAIALTGTALQLAVQAFNDHRRQRHERYLIFSQERREAYVEIITWFALVRDHVRECMHDAKPWDSEIVDALQNARMDALTQLYGSEPFRAATAEFRAPLNEAVKSLAKLVNFREAGLAGTDAGEALRVEVGARAEDLATVINKIRYIARSEVAGIFEDELAKQTRS